MSEDTRHIHARRFAVGSSGFHGEDDLNISAFKQSWGQSTLRVSAKRDGGRNVIRKRQHAEILPVQWTGHCLSEEICNAVYDWIPPHGLFTEHLFKRLLECAAKCFSIGFF